MRLSVADEFTTTPGPRSRDEGEFSGEQFLTELLLPRFQTAEKAREELLIDLDRTEGYANSFLEAAFGGLAREVGEENVQRVLKFKSDDEPFLIEEISKYIKEACVR
jgi:STAS-like domain of unknown function (DUF4325)